MKTILALVLLAALTIGAANADRWIALWTEDDSWVGMKEDGDVWQLVPGNDPVPAGDFGPGPWIEFSKSWSDHAHYALRPNGEVWRLSSLGPSGVGVLFRSLPSDREWCALLTVPEACEGPEFTLACNGEVWVLTDPPRYVESFGDGPVQVTPSTWGQLRERFR